MHHIIEISCQRAKFRLVFCSTDNEISFNISFWKAKFRATVYVGNEISWNISFVGVEIKLNVLRRTNCMRSRTKETRRFPFIPLAVSDWLIRKHHPIKDKQTARQLQAVTQKNRLRILGALNAGFFFLSLAV